MTPLDRVYIQQIGEIFRVRALTLAEETYARAAAAGTPLSTDELRQIFARCVQRIHERAAVHAPALRAAIMRKSDKVAAAILEQIFAEATAEIRELAGGQCDIDRAATEASNAVKH